MQVLGVAPSQLTAPIAPRVPKAGLPVMAKVRPLPSTSPPESVIVLAVSSSVETLWPAAVGASLTAVTESVKDSLALRPPGSVTVTVISALPFWFAAGVTVSVRLAPLPPKTYAAGSGRSVVLSEPTPSVSRVSSPSGSSMVTVMAPVAASSRMVRSAIAAMVGGVLAVIVKVTGALSLSLGGVPLPLSRSTTVISALPVVASESKVSTPVGEIAGGTTKKLGLLLLVMTNSTVWPLSFAGPALMAVAHGAL